MSRPPPRSTLFPYTTLFRSNLTSTPALLLRLLDVAFGLCGLGRVGRHLRVHLLALRLHVRLVVGDGAILGRSEEHTSELQSHVNLVCRLLLEKKKKNNSLSTPHALSRSPTHDRLPRPSVPQLFSRSPYSEHSFCLLPTLCLPRAESHSCVHSM